MSIETHPSATDGLVRAAGSACISDEDSGIQDSSVGCDPGPDSDLEDVLLPEDRVPARSGAAPVPTAEPAPQNETPKDA